MPLRLASSNSKRLQLDPESYIDVVEDISKRDFNRLIAAMPAELDEGGLTPLQGTEFQTSLFDIFVRGWSLDDAPSVENYLSLSRESAALVDVALVEHFNSLTPDAPKEEKPSKSRTK